MVTLLSQMWYRITNMTEKQTFTPESAPQSDDAELISQEDLDMVNSWSQPEAPSPATADIDTSSPTYSIPIAEVGRADASPQPRRRPTAGQIGWSAAAAASIIAGGLGLASTAGGSDNPERGEVDQNITSITLDPEANIRQDPNVADEPNIAVPQLGAEVKIDAAHDIRVLEGTNNGTWYGINAEDITAKAPDAAVNDKDGVVWINEQGIESITTNDTQETNE